MNKITNKHIKRLNVLTKLPPRFDKERKNGKVYKLRKSLYGLKQSPRASFDQFNKALCQHRYKQPHADHT